MDLWVYSQDKKYLQEIKGFKNDKSNIWGYSYTDTGILLGTYETKERALEVLDEIKSLIETNYECCYNKKVDAYFECNDVYEMPEK